MTASVPSVGHMTATTGTAPSSPPRASSANDRQVGGTHYKMTHGEQHWDMMWRLFREAWFVGAITKYVLRYRKKNGLQDLEKARHYLDKLIELEREDADRSNSITTECGHDYDVFSRTFGGVRESVCVCVKCLQPKPKETA